MAMTSGVQRGRATQICASSNRPDGVTVGILGQPVVPHGDAVVLVGEGVDEGGGLVVIQGDRKLRVLHVA